MRYFHSVLSGMLILCQLSIYPCKAQLLLTGGTQPIPFEWLSDTIQGRPEPYAAMLIPVRLPSRQEQFYMQFDLGSPYSLLYREALTTIPAADTASRLYDLHFSAGPVTIRAKEMRVQAAGHAFSRQIIGTIGADLINQRIAVIDYPRKMLLISDTIPGQQPALSPFIFARGRVLLPAMLKGKQTLLYFDSGSSAYALLTDEATCQSLAAPDAIPAEYPVQSWGQTLTAHTFASHDSVTIASMQLPIGQATYISGVSEQQVVQMRKLGIGGMTGNKLFLNSVLILDTKRQLFGLYQR